MTLRVCMVDDEAPARRKVARLLAADPRFEWAGEAGDGRSGLALVREARPDLLILDVRMPEMDGISLLAAMEGTTPPLVIFSTAHDRYAVRAFDVEAVDYLLKPYDAARFNRALDRAHDLWSARRASRADPGRLALRDGGRWESFALADVVRISAAGKQVEITLRDGRTVTTRGPLQRLADRLPPEGFVRAHRGEIVAIRAARRLEPTPSGDAILELEGGISVVVSRTHKSAVMAAIGRSPRGT